MKKLIILIVLCFCSLVNSTEEWIMGTPQPTISNTTNEWSVGSPVVLLEPAAAPAGTGQVIIVIMSGLPLLLIIGIAFGFMYRGRENGQSISSG